MTKNNKLVDEISKALSKLNEESKAFSGLFETYMRPNISLLEGENKLEKISELISHSEQKIIQLRGRRDQILKCLEAHPLWVKKRAFIKVLQKQMANLNEELSEERNIQKLSDNISKNKRKNRSIKSNKRKNAERTRVSAFFR